MNRFEISILALASSLSLSWSPLAQSAGDAANGSALYHTTYRCTTCHSSNPGPGNIVAAGATPEGLHAAITTVTDMAARYLTTLGNNASDLADISAYIASVTSASVVSADAIEYYHAAFDHYFITAIADEITKLDAGVFAGWARTGLKLKVYPSATAGASTVCRFFSTSFAPKSSHFYTPSATECATVKTNPNWQYEGDVFYVTLALANGTCPTGTVAIYRLYNNGQGGAPNHRYTTDATVRDTMVAHGWVIEGNGPGFAFMCGPA
jgi:mono/diheme cytochrome c family protein